MQKKIAVLSLCASILYGQAVANPNATLEDTLICSDVYPDIVFENERIGCQYKQCKVINNRVWHAFAPSHLRALNVRAQQQMVNNATTPSNTTNNTSMVTNSSTTETTTTSSTTTTTTTTTTTRKTWPRPDCGNPRLTNRERGIFLDMHNNYRSTLVQGQTQINAGWGIAPPATIIYRMKYDCDAESYAQQAVSTCRTTLLPPYATGPHKQNIHLVTGSATRDGAIQNAVASWWNQISSYGFRSNMLFLPSENTRGAQSVTSWSKMAWWNNRRVGCALQHCGAHWVVSCMYNPGGNYEYNHVYRVGAVCSECNECDFQFLCRW